MRKALLDFIVVTVLLTAGLAVTGNLDKPADYAFAVVFGLAYAAFHLGMTRRRTARPDPTA